MQTSKFAAIQNETLEVFSRNLFFISGVPKSGTTWIQKALDTHPQISCFGEGHFFDVFADFIRQSNEIYNKKLLDIVTREVYEGKPYYQHLTDQDFDFLVISFIGLMLSKIGIKESARYIGDKTPINVLMLEYIYRIFPEAKLIHMYRDGRDVVLSTYMHGRRNGEHRSFAECIELIGARWVEYNQAAIEFNKKHKNTLLMVSYETMTRDFMKCFSNVLQFLGADHSMTAVEHCRASSSFEQLSGGRRPGEENPLSFYRKGVVGDWKNYFSAQNIEAFNRIGGKMLEELGFETSSKANITPPQPILPIHTSYSSAESRP